jgi:heme exporter protein D
MRCQACGNGDSVRPALTVHHVIPVELRGRDVLSNLTTLCANCHRFVHWLAKGDRSVLSRAYAFAQSVTHRRRLLALARRIRRRRLRIVGPDLKIKDSVSLQIAMDAVIKRNGLDRPEGVLLRRCFNRALRAMSAHDRKACSVRLVRGERFISVNANNHLTIRAPAWSDRSKRYEEDIILIWPQGVRPSIIAPSKFRHASSGAFKLIPCVNLYLTWDECLALSKRDWMAFRKACTSAFSVASRRWTSNVTLE